MPRTARLPTAARRAPRRWRALSRPLRASAQPAAAAAARRTPRRPLRTRHRLRPSSHPRVSLASCAPFAHSFPRIARIQYCTLCMHVTISSSIRTTPYRTAYTCSVYPLMSSLCVAPFPTHALTPNCSHSHSPETGRARVWVLLAVPERRGHPPQARLLHGSDRPLRERQTRHHCRRRRYSNTYEYIVQCSTLLHYTVYVY